MGRPTKYRPEYVEQVKNYCELGATDAEIARFFKVHKETIYVWKATYPEFAKAMELAKEKADKLVEDSLFHRARGFSHESEDIFLYKGKPVRVPVVKKYPPDTVAAIFWLKNRKPEEWRDVKAVEHSGQITNRHVNELSDDQISDRLEQIARERARLAGGDSAKERGKAKSKGVH